MNTETTAPVYESHASAVLYPAIDAAMKELQTVPAGSNAAVDRAFNALHAAFWSECPAPASAPVLRAID
jgi:acyl-CoA reductase-like NAD-dependent aldehyde dehydrogenase